MSGDNALDGGSAAAAGLDQRSKQPALGALITQIFRVPLHADHETRVARFNRLHEAIGIASGGPGLP